MADRTTFAKDVMAGWKRNFEETQKTKPAAAKKAKKARASAAAATPAVQTAPAAPRRPVVPLTKQLKAALDALQQKRLPLSISELEKAISYSVAPGSELVTALKQHENVEFTSSEEFCYKAQYSITNRQEVLAFLAKRPEGTHLGDIKDAYKGIIEDVEKLKRANKITAWKHYETEEYVLYPKDAKLQINVDADLVAEWLKQPLPSNAAELEAAMRKAKIQPLPRPATEVQPKQKRGRQRKQRQLQVHKATNEHLPELFVGPQAKSIEER